MRLTLLGIGRLKVGAERDIFQRYFARLADLGRAQGIAKVEAREIDESRARRPADRRAAEAALLLGALQKGDRLALLDERGALLSSPQWAGDIAKARDGATPGYVVAIGGPDGVDDSVRARAQIMISFGAVTWPHQLMRAMACEQLYRALTILAGSPYHRA